MNNTDSAYNALLNASANDRAQIEAAIKQNFTEQFYASLIEKRVQAGRNFDDILEALVKSRTNRSPVTASVEHPQPEYRNFNTKFEADLANRLRDFVPSHRASQAVSAAVDREKFRFALETDHHSTVGNFNDGSLQEKSLKAAMEKTRQAHDVQTVAASSGNVADVWPHAKQYRTI